MGENIPCKSTFSDRCLLQINMWGRGVLFFLEYIRANVFLLGTRTSAAEVYFTRGQNQNRASIYSWYIQRLHQLLSFCSVEQIVDF